MTRFYLDEKYDKINTFKLNYQIMHYSLLIKLF